MCQLRVKLLAGIYLEFVDYLLSTECISVCSVARHGVVAVGDGDNSRIQWYLVAFKPPRISGTVIPLVVAVDVFGDALHSVNTAQYAIAHLWVAAYFLPLLNRQGGLFVYGAL